MVKISEKQPMMIYIVGNHEGVASCNQDAGAETHSIPVATLAQKLKLKCRKMKLRSLVSWLQYPLF